MVCDGCEKHCEITVNRSCIGLELIGLGCRDGEELLISKLADPQWMIEREREQK